MGSGGAKETNRQLAEQAQEASRRAGVADVRSAEQYGQVSGLPGEILGNYRDIYAGIGEGGGGGGEGGPRYSPAAFESTALPFYSGLMEEGGYSPEAQANMLSYATGPISGLFEGLKRNIETAGAGRGLPGYSSRTGRLARDQAYETSNLAKGVSGDLAKMILQSKLQGASGVRGIEGEKRAFETAERGRAHSAAARRAGAGRASGQQDFRNRMAVLGAMGGYRPGSDVEYMGLGMGGTGQAIGAAGARRDETPMWQKAAGSLIPSAAGAAVGAFSNPFRRTASAPPPGGTGMIS